MTRDTTNDKQTGKWRLLHHGERKEAYSGWLVSFFKKAYVKYVKTNKSKENLLRFWSVGGGRWKCTDLSGIQEGIGLTPRQRACLLSISCHSYVLRIVEGLSHRQKKPWAPAAPGLKERVNSSCMPMLTDSSLWVRNQRQARLKTPNSVVYMRYYLSV